MIRFIPIALSTSIGGLALLGLYTLLLPNCSVGTLQYANNEGVSFSAPEVTQSVSQEKSSADFIMFLAPMRITDFSCLGSNYVSSMTVNGRAIQPEGGFKSTSSSQILRLGPYLQTGPNRVHVDFFTRSKWITFLLMPSIRDPWIISLSALVLVLLALLILWFSRLVPSQAFSKCEVALFLSASALRILYCVATPYIVRGYDVKSGHIPYIRCIAQKWILPTIPSQTFEYFQPPAYYFLCAVSTQLLNAIGVCYNSIVQAWLAESCALAIAAMFAFVGIARLLFPGDLRYRRYFYLAMAIFPAHVFIFSGINNDVLFATLSIFWLWALLEFWRRCSFTKWLIVSLLLGAALLTKANAIALIGVSFFVLLCTKQIRRSSKAILLVVSAVLIMIVNAWFYMPRALASRVQVSTIVSNLNLIPTELLIHEDIHKLTTFSPVSVIKYPYSHQFNLCDPRREFFWEYFFKSAFFGENFFCILEDNRLVNARLILLTAMALLPTIVLGFKKLLSYRDPAVPLFMTVSIVTTCHLLYLMQAPYICSQTFRYSAILVAPLTYFSLQGIKMLTPLLRRVGEGVFLTLLAACAFYICSLCFG